MLKISWKFNHNWIDFTKAKPKENWEMSKKREPHADSFPVVLKLGIRLFLKIRNLFPLDTMEFLKTSLQNRTWWQKTFTTKVLKKSNSNNFWKTLTKHVLTSWSSCKSCIKTKILSEPSTKQACTRASLEVSDTMAARKPKITNNQKSETVCTVIGIWWP